jgi:hypothetical protein
MDIRELKFDDNSFDVAIDKGLLDILVVRAKYN